ncbi:MAG: xanthine dehydrogenase family protein subunit M [Acidimicrobiia bacterium]|nr:MAG: xanthine dehydrogenase family protein subunit M [Acidimicrobiia bacterium]
MYPSNFDYVAPTSLDEALAALSGSENAKLLSGGMSLLPLMKMRLVRPTTVVDISRIPGLDTITDEGDHIAIGALVKHADTASSELVGKHATALAQAAGTTADIQVRNQGTTCGSIAHADLAADQPAAALALGATMVAASVRGEREIAAADFFVDTLTSALEDDEILVELRVPKGGKSAYAKLGRRGGDSDYPIAAAAVWVDASDGTVADARIAVTGVSSKPYLAVASAQAVVGTDGSGDAIASAASHATDDVVVLEDLYGSVEYRTHLASVFVKRALEGVLG